MVNKKNKPIDTIFGYRHPNHRIGSTNNTIIYTKEKWKKGILTINLDNSVIISYHTHSYTAIIDANFFVKTNGWIKMSLPELILISKKTIGEKTKIIDINEIPSKCTGIIA